MQVARQKVELRLISKRAIRDLRGFDRSRGHTVPKTFGAASIEYLRSIYEEELAEELQLIYERAKRILKFRRHELSKTITENFGSLEAPDFCFTLEFSQSEEEPEKIQLERRIQVKKAIADCHPLFFELFPFLPEQVVYPLEGSMDFDELVYRFEELELKHGGTLKEDDRTGLIEYSLGGAFFIRVCLQDRELAISSTKFENTLTFYQESEELVDLLT